MSLASDLAGLTDLMPKNNGVPDGYSDLFDYLLSGTSIDPRQYFDPADPKDVELNTQALLHPGSLTPAQEQTIAAPKFFWPSDGQMHDKPPVSIPGQGGAGASGAVGGRTQAQVAQAFKGGPAGGGGGSMAPRATPVIPPTPMGVQLPEFHKARLGALTMLGSNPDPAAQRIIEEIKNRTNQIIDFVNGKYGSPLSPSALLTFASAGLNLKQIDKIIMHAPDVLTKFPQGATATASVGAPQLPGLNITREKMQPLTIAPPEGEKPLGDRLITPETDTRTGQIPGVHGSQSESPKPKNIVPDLHPGDEQISGIVKEAGADLFGIIANAMPKVAEGIMDATTVLTGAGTKTDQVGRYSPLAPQRHQEIVDDLTVINGQISKLQSELESSPMDSTLTHGGGLKDSTFGYEYDPHYSLDGDTLKAIAALEDRKKDLLDEKSEMEKKDIYGLKPAYANPVPIVTYEETLSAPMPTKYWQELLDAGKRTLKDSGLTEGTPEYDEALSAAVHEGVLAVDSPQKRMHLRQAELLMNDPALGRKNALNNIQTRAMIDAQSATALKEEIASIERLAAEAGISPQEWLAAKQEGAKLKDEEIISYDQMVKLLPYKEKSSAGLNAAGALYDSTIGIDSTFDFSRTLATLITGEAPAYVNGWYESRMDGVFNKLMFDVGINTYPDVADARYQPLDDAADYHTLDVDLNKGGRSFTTADIAKIENVTKSAGENNFIVPTITLADGTVIENWVRMNTKASNPDIARHYQETDEEYQTRIETQGNTETSKYWSRLPNGAGVPMADFGTNRDWFNSPNEMIDVLRKIIAAADKNPIYPVALQRYLNNIPDGAYRVYPSNVMDLNTTVALIKLTQDNASADAISRMAAIAEKQNLNPDNMAERFGKLMNSSGWMTDSDIAKDAQLQNDLHVTQSCARLLMYGGHDEKGNPYPGLTSPGGGENKQFWSLVDLPYSGSLFDNPAEYDPFAGPEALAQAKSTRFELMDPLAEGEKYFKALTAPSVDWENISSGIDALMGSIALDRENVLSGALQMMIRNRAPGMLPTEVVQNVINRNGEEGLPKQYHAGTIFKWNKSEHFLEDVGTEWGNLKDFFNNVEEAHGNFKTAAHYVDAVAHNLWEDNKILHPDKFFAEGSLAATIAQHATSPLHDVNDLYMGINHVAVAVEWTLKHEEIFDEFGNTIQIDDKPLLSRLSENYDKSEGRLLISEAMKQMGVDPLEHPMFILGAQLAGDWLITKGLAKGANLAYTTPIKLASELSEQDAIVAMARTSSTLKNKLIIPAEIYTKELAQRISLTHNFEDVRGYIAAAYGGEIPATAKFGKTMTMQQKLAPLAYKLPQNEGAMKLLAATKDSTDPVANAQTNHLIRLLIPGLEHGDYHHLVPAIRKAASESEVLTLLSDYAKTSGTNPWHMFDEMALGPWRQAARLLIDKTPDNNISNFVKMALNPLREVNNDGSISDADRTLHGYIEGFGTQSKVGKSITDEVLGIYDLMLDHNNPVLNPENKNILKLPVINTLVQAILEDKALGEAARKSYSEHNSTAGIASVLNDLRSKTVKEFGAKDLDTIWDTAKASHQIDLTDTVNNLLQVIGEGKNAIASGKHLPLLDELNNAAMNHQILNNDVLRQTIAKHLAGEDMAEHVDESMAQISATGETTAAAMETFLQHLQFELDSAFTSSIAMARQAGPEAFAAQKATINNVLDQMSAAHYAIDTDDPARALLGQAISKAEEYLAAGEEPDYIQGALLSKLTVDMLRLKDGLIETLPEHFTWAEDLAKIDIDVRRAMEKIDDGIFSIYDAKSDFMTLDATNQMLHLLDEFSTGDFVSATSQVLHSGEIDAATVAVIKERQLDVKMREAMMQRHLTNSNPNQYLSSPAMLVSGSMKIDHLAESTKEEILAHHNQGGYFNFSANGTSLVGDTPGFDRAAQEYIISIGGKMNIYYTGKKPKYLAEGLIYKTEVDGKSVIKQRVGGKDINASLETPQATVIKVIPEEGHVPPNKLWDVEQSAVYEQMMIDSDRALLAHADNTEGINHIIDMTSGRIPVDIQDYELKNRKITGEYYLPELKDRTARELKPGGKSETRLVENIGGNTMGEAQPFLKTLVETWAIDDPSVGRTPLLKNTIKAAIDEVHREINQWNSPPIVAPELSDAVTELVINKIQEALLAASPELVSDVSKAYFHYSSELPMPRRNAPRRLGERVELPPKESAKATMADIYPEDVLLAEAYEVEMDIGKQLRLSRIDKDRRSTNIDEYSDGESIFDIKDGTWYFKPTNGTFSSKDVNLEERMYEELGITSQDKNYPNAGVPGPELADDLRPQGETARKETPLEAMASALLGAYWTAKPRNFNKVLKWSHKEPPVASGHVRLYTDWVELTKQGREKEVIIDHSNPRNFKNQLVNGDIRLVPMYTRKTVRDGEVSWSLNDPVLNRVWHIAPEGEELTPATFAYMDVPYREMIDNPGIEDIAPGRYYLPEDMRITRADDHLLLQWRTDEGIKPLGIYDESMIDVIQNFGHWDEGVLPETDAFSDIYHSKDVRQGNIPGDERLVDEISDEADPQLGEELYGAEDPGFAEIEKTGADPGILSVQAGYIKQKAPGDVLIDAGTQEANKMYREHDYKLVDPNTAALDGDEVARMVAVNAWKVIHEGDNGKEFKQILKYQLDHSELSAEEIANAESLGSSMIDQIIVDLKDHVAKSPESARYIEEQYLAQMRDQGSAGRANPAIEDPLVNMTYGGKQAAAPESVTRNIVHNESLLEFFNVIEKDIRENLAKVTEPGTWQSAIMRKFTPGIYEEGPYTKNWRWVAGDKQHHPADGKVLDRIAQNGASLNFPELHNGRRFRALGKSQSKTSTKVWVQYEGENTASKIPADYLTKNQQERFMEMDHLTPAKAKLAAKVNDTTFSTIDRTRIWENLPEGEIAGVGDVRDFLLQTLRTNTIEDTKFKLRSIQSRVGKKYLNLDLDKARTQIYAEGGNKGDRFLQDLSEIVQAAKSGKPHPGLEEAISRVTNRDYQFRNIKADFGAGELDKDALMSGLELTPEEIEALVQDRELLQAMQQEHVRTLEQLANELDTRRELRRRAEMVREGESTFDTKVKRPAGEVTQTLDREELIQRVDEIYQSLGETLPKTINLESAAEEAGLKVPHADVGHVVREMGTSTKSTGTGGFVNFADSSQLVLPKAIALSDNSPQLHTLLAAEEGDRSSKLLSAAIRLALDKGADPRSPEYWNDIWALSHKVAHTQRRNAALPGNQLADVFLRGNSQIGLEEKAQIRQTITEANRQASDFLHVLDSRDPSGRIKAIVMEQKNKHRELAALKQRLASTQDRDEIIALREEINGVSNDLKTIQEQAKAAVGKRNTVRLPVQDNGSYVMKPSVNMHDLAYYLRYGKDSYQHYANPGTIGRMMNMITTNMKRLWLLNPASFIRMSMGDEAGWRMWAEHMRPFNPYTAGRKAPGKPYKITIPGAIANSEEGTALQRVTGQMLFGESKINYEDIAEMYRSLGQTEAARVWLEAIYGHKVGDKFNAAKNVRNPGAGLAAIENLYKTNPMVDNWRIESAIPKSEDLVSGLMGTQTRQKMASLLDKAFRDSFRLDDPAIYELYLKAQKGDKFSKADFDAALAQMDNAKLPMYHEKIYGSRIGLGIGGAINNHGFNLLDRVTRKADSQRYATWFRRKFDEMTDEGRTPEESWNHAAKAAHQYASQKVRENTYNMSRTALEGRLKNVYPFMAAQRDFLTYWAKDVIKNPQHAVMLGAAQQIPKTVDADWYKNAPGMGDSPWLHWMISPDTALYFVGDPLSMLPGLGPVYSSIANKSLLKAGGGVGKTLEKIVNNLPGGAYLGKDNSIASHADNAVYGLTGLFKYMLTGGKDAKGEHIPVIGKKDSTNRDQVKARAMAMYMEEASAGLVPGPWPDFANYLTELYARASSQIAQETGMMSLAQSLNPAGAAKDDLAYKTYKAIQGLTQAYSLEEYDQIIAALEGAGEWPEHLQEDYGWIKNLPTGSNMPGAVSAMQAVKEFKELWLVADKDGRNALMNNGYYGKPYLLPLITVASGMNQAWGYGSAESFVENSLLAGEQNIQTTTAGLAAAETAANNQPAPGGPPQTPEQIDAATAAVASYGVTPITAGDIGYGNEEAAAAGSLYGQREMAGPSGGSGGGGGGSSESPSEPLPSPYGAIRNAPTEAAWLATELTDDMNSLQKLMSKNPGQLSVGDRKLIGMSDDPGAAKGWAEYQKTYTDIMARKDAELGASTNIWDYKAVAYAQELDGAIAGLKSKYGTSFASQYDMSQMPEWVRLKSVGFGQGSAVWQNAYRALEAASGDMATLKGAERDARYKEAMDVINKLKETNPEFAKDWNVLDKYGNMQPGAMQLKAYTGSFKYESDTTSTRRGSNWKNYGPKMGFEEWWNLQDKMPYEKWTAIRHESVSSEVYAKYKAARYATKQKKWAKDKMLRKARSGGTSSGRKKVAYVKPVYASNIKAASTYSKTAKGYIKKKYRKKKR